MKINLSTHNGFNGGGWWITSKSEDENFSREWYAPYSGGLWSYANGDYKQQRGTCQFNISDKRGTAHAQIKRELDY